MEENESKAKKKSNLEIQDYLSLGYVFLLVLGVLHQAIYYKYLGVNILEYSSVLDVLLSPVSVLTGDNKLLIGMSICLVLASIYARFLPKYYMWLSKKKRYQSGKSKERIEKSLKAFKEGSKQLVVVMMMLFVIGGYVGFGFGKGSRTQEKIEKGEIELSHQITFEDQDTINVKMLGKNSLYVFYITKNDNDELVLHYSDNGPGISCSIKGSVFNPFFTTKKSGTGLGLAICQSLMKKIEGSIELTEKQRLKGANFLLKFPKQNQEKIYEHTYY